MKNLIIYFSVFGSTKRFAEMVRQTVDGGMKDEKGEVKETNAMKEAYEMGLSIK